MRRLAIDTNIYSAMHRRDVEVINRLQESGEILIPYVVLAELRAGFRGGSREAENETTLNRFLGAPGVRSVYPDERTTLVYADLTAWLRRNGTPVPQNDVWIAALCVQHAVPLYTRDTHFGRLPQVMRV